MTPYADYTYYTGTYHGNQIAESDFARLSLRSTSFIDYYTRGKATSAMDAVKMACCALAEQYQIIEKVKQSTLTAGGEVQSQTVGAYSVTYKSGSESSEALQADLTKIAQMYLAGTGLLYRGGACCVCSACCDSL